MNLEQTLNKENFFNEMMEKYPKATGHFCEWIDEYKKAVNWNALFGGNTSGLKPKNNIRVGKTPPKFHEIPYAMQYGIWIEYCRQELSNFFEQPEHVSQFIDLREDIEEVFAAWQ